MGRGIRIIFLLLSCLAFGSPLLAQQGNIWTFGDLAGVDFNSGSPVSFTGSAMTTIEGSATISDNNGNLLFYTHGSKVWDKNHNQMPNGFGLLGDSSSSQSGIIVPHPANPNLYFIVTVDDIPSTNGMNYSEVDITLNGGFGDVVVATKNTSMFAPSTERVTAVTHSNGTDIWIIGHEVGNNRYLAYLIDATGVNLTPVVSDVGVVHELGSHSIGYLKATSQGDRIGVVLNKLTVDTIDNVEVLDFDNTTGLISNPISWDPPFTNLYGLEFSPNGNLLYVSGLFGGGIHQYNLLAGSATAIAASDVQISAANKTAIQLAPDGKLYAAHSGLGFLAVINAPDVPGIGCNFQDSAVNIMPATGRLGLPNFAPSFFLNISINFTGLCQNDTSFFSTDTANVNSVLWSFGDPASGTADTSTSFLPFHIFSDTGTFTVTLVAFGLGGNDTVIKNIKISDIPSANLGNDTSLCQGDTLILDAYLPGFTYTWQDNSTDSIFEVTAAGTYSVAVQNICGTTNDTILVSLDDSLVFTLGPDSVLCEGNTYTIDPNITAAANYLWHDNSTGSTFEATQSDTVILNATNGCGTFSDTTIIEVTPLPIAGLPADTIICNDIQLVLNTPGEDSVSYIWQDSSTVSFQNIDTSGSYWLAAFNDCGFTIDTFNVTFIAPITTELGPDTTICSEDTLELIATSAGATSYLWSDGSIDTSLQVSQTGTYLVTVTSEPCTLTDQLDVVLDRNTCFEGIDCAIIAPNVFTPNNDGINDEFLVSSSCSFTGYQLTVYSRWGQKVFTSNRPLLGWDGSAGGLPLPNGVYYWLLDYQHEVVVDVDRNEQAGSVSLMR